MKRLVLAVIAFGMMLAGAVHSAEELHNPGGIGGLESLRGASELEATRAADPMKRFPRDQARSTAIMFTSHLWFRTRSVITKYRRMPISAWLATAGKMPMKWARPRSA